MDVRSSTPLAQLKIGLIGSKYTWEDWHGRDLTLNQLDKIAEILGQIGESNKSYLVGREVTLYKDKVEIRGSSEGTQVSEDIEISNPELAQELYLLTRSWKKSPSTLPFLASILSATMLLLPDPGDVPREPGDELPPLRDLPTYLIAGGKSLLKKVGLWRKERTELTLPVLPKEAMTQTYRTDDGKVVGTETATAVQDSNTSFALRALAGEHGWKEVREGNKYNFSKITNAWSQELKTPEGKRQAQCARLGGITDGRNGFYSLQWLKEVDALKMNERIEYLFGLEQKNLTEDQREAVTFERDRLEKLRDAYIDDFNGEFQRLKKELIAERRAVLASQMDQYVALQLRTNKELLKEGEDFHLYHLCLLNLNKEKLGKPGVGLSERVMFEDMAEIFKEYEKEVTYEGVTVKLRPHLLNCSVQGKRDTSLQSERNKDQVAAFGLDPKTAAKLVEEDRPGWVGWAVTSVLKLLQLKAVTQLYTPGYSTAIDTADQMMDKVRREQNGAVGISCWSGKDRTGAVVGLAMGRQIRKTARGLGDVDFKDEVFGPESLAAKIVECNTENVCILKAVPNVELSKEAGLTPLKRIAYLASQVFVNLRASV